MVKYTKVKLFAFYLMMAFASLWDNEHGKAMIDAAQAGKGEGPIQW